MWALYQTLGMFTHIFEAILDKKFILKNNIDDVQSSFLRLFTYTIIIIILSFILNLGFELLITFDIFLVGFVGALSSIMYSNLVRKQDVSVVIIVPVIMPVLFYFLDHYLLSTTYNLYSSISLIISIIGSVFFIKNHKKFNYYSVFNILVMLIYGIIEFYILKKTNIHPFLFFGNTVLISTICVGIYLVLNRNFKIFTYEHLEYVKGTFLSKFLDVISSYMYGMAILLTTGFKFSMFQLIFAPLTLIVLSILIKFKLLPYEYLDINKKTLIALFFIIIGEYLMFIS